MRALVLDDHTLAAIAAADARARAKPVPWSVLQQIAITDPKVKNLKLADRAPDHQRPQAENVLIQFGFRAAVSYEQQPAGLVKHLSISVDKPGALPNQVAVEAIMKAFGIDAADNAWLEEFDPGHQAVNIVAIVGPSNVPAGRA